MEARNFYENETAIQQYISHCLQYNLKHINTLVLCYLLSNSKSKELIFKTTSIALRSFLLKQYNSFRSNLRQILI